MLLNMKEIEWRLKHSEGDECPFVEEILPMLEELKSSDLTPYQIACKLISASFDVMITSYPNEEFLGFANYLATLERLAYRIHIEREAYIRFKTGGKLEMPKLEDLPNWW